MSPIPQFYPIRFPYFRKVFSDISRLRFIEKSPSRREHGDTGSNRKSSRRSTSRRRSNQRERESRQELAHKEIEAQPREMDDETYNVGMELDDDQGDVHVDCNTPPDDHKNE